MSSKGESLLDVSDTSHNPSYKDGNQNPAWECIDSRPESILSQNINENQQQQQMDKMKHSSLWSGLYYINNTG